LTDDSRSHDENAECDRHSGDDSVPSGGEGEGLELFARISRGDVSAFEGLFNRYSRALCGFAYSYVRRRDIAQEIVQDVFCRVWTQREALTVRTSMRVYLYAAVRNRALDYLVRRRLEQSVEHRSDTQAYHSSISGPVVDEQMVEDERRALLVAAIAELPERQRAVFELRWQHHLPYAEIARVLGMTVKGVESARARAIESLQHRLQGVWGT